MARFKYWIMHQEIIKYYFLCIIYLAVFVTLLALTGWGIYEVLTAEGQINYVKKVNVELIEVKVGLK